MDQIATAAVIGGVYCGAFLWLYRDEAEKPKREAEGGAGGLAGSGHGLETIIGELYTIRDRLDAMDQTSRWMAGGCRKGPLIVVGTGGGSDKVHTLRISPDRQLLVPTAEAVTVAQNPSFVSASADRSVVYAIGEGVATALAVDHDKGELAPLGEKQSANGAGTAFIEPDGANKHVLVANYVGGSVCVLPVREDGSLGPATDAKAHTPRSPPKPALADRQAEAHPHSVRVDPWTKRWALVPDLGKDTCYVYAYDGERGVLAGAESNERHFRTREGAGPRHLDFSAAVCSSARARGRCCCSRPLGAARPPAHRARPRRPARRASPPSHPRAHAPLDLPAISPCDLLAISPRSPRDLRRARRPPAPRTACTF